MYIIDRRGGVQKSYTRNIPGGQRTFTSTHNFFPQEVAGMVFFKDVILYIGNNN